MRPNVPQPSPERMVPIPGHPLVVGIKPGQPDLVALSAAAWARALGGVDLYFAYADPARILEEELPGGYVRHAPLNPDIEDDAWRDRVASINAFLDRTLGERDVNWHFRYLAGRADRALTHLARTVDASAFVIGAKEPLGDERLHDLFASSIGLHLARHQHRPVLLVPLRVVDWKAPTPW